MERVERTIVRRTDETSEGNVIGILKITDDFVKNDGKMMNF